MKFYSLFAFIALTNAVSIKQQSSISIQGKQKDDDTVAEARQKWALMQA